MSDETAVWERAAPTAISKAGYGGTTSFHLRQDGRFVRSVPPVRA
ncbi:hypothetical protein [Arthrobacter sp. Marseille-P9274]|nr:hypothetical protein [Arthrobacter sp. Marseille-P9274]